MDDCNSGHTGYNKTVGKSEKQRRELLIYRGKGEWEELLQTKCPLEYTGGLKRNGFSLAELWPSHWLGYCQARR